MPRLGAPFYRLLHFRNIDAALRKRSESLVLNKTTVLVALVSQFPILRANDQHHEAREIAARRWHEGLSGCGFVPSNNNVGKDKRCEIHMRRIRTAVGARLKIGSSQILLRIGNEPSPSARERMELLPTHFFTARTRPLQAACDMLEIDRVLSSLSSQ